LPGNIQLYVRLKLGRRRSEVDSPEGAVFATDADLLEPAVLQEHDHGVPCLVEGRALLFRPSRTLGHEATFRQLG
jgi:hypothetical protein